MLKFFKNVFDDVIAIIGLELRFHSSQRNADNIAVMEFRCGILFSELQP